MTIGRLLKQKASVTSIGVGDLGASKRVRKAQCPEVETTTFSWFTRMQENGVALSDDLVIAAAKRLYALLPRDESEKELQFSNGWVEKFKRRFQIRVMFVTERMHQQILQQQF